MIFEITATKPDNPEDSITLFYNNENNELKNSDGHVYEWQDKQVNPYRKKFKDFGKGKPLTKSRAVNHLKIQLGLACNYSCEYCSQKFVERPETTRARNIEPFMKMLDNLEISELAGLRVEFWGGEPLVYWKTLKPLAEAIYERYKHWTVKPKFTMITNGSLLNDDIIDFLMRYDFNVSISHDGPGQSVRGPDPFDDPQKKETILGFYRMMKRLKKGFSFNPMLNKKNISRKAVYDWFVELTGDEDVQLGEGGFVDAYDADGAASSLTTKAAQFEFRKTAFGDLYSTGGQIGFNQIVQKAMAFGQSILNQEEAQYLGQKCGMDGDNVLSVDLNGKIFTCQNVSAVETAMNGNSHFGGFLDDFDNVRINSSTHWSNRDHCRDCPVLHLCKGSCMFLDGELWDISCDNAYSDNVALFALTLTELTGGYVPVEIKDAEGKLPLHRQDIWGTLYEHKEREKLELIPVKIISEKDEVVEGVEVYSKSRVEKV